MKYLNILIGLTLLVSIGCAQPKATRNTPVFKIGKIMNEGEFWKIINYASEVAGEDQEKEQQLIIQKLSEYPAEQIVDFELIFTKKLIAINDFEILAAATIIEGSITDDGWLYFKCWLVSRGETIYNETIKNPEYLASVTQMGVVADFESMLYVSTEAYKKSTGKTEVDESFPREIAFKKGLNYESDGARMVGKDWKPEDLPKLYPKLWNKFN